MAMPGWIDYYDDSVIMPSPDVVERLNRGIDRERTFEPVVTPAATPVPVTMASQFIPSQRLSTVIPTRPQPYVTGQQPVVKRPSSRKPSRNKDITLPPDRSHPATEGQGRTLAEEIAFQHPNVDPVFPNDGFAGIPLTNNPIVLNEASSQPAINKASQYRSAGPTDTLEVAFMPGLQEVRGKIKSPQIVQGKINTSSGNINYSSIANADKQTLPYDIRSVLLRQPRYPFAKNGKVIAPLEESMPIPLPLQITVPTAQMPIPIEELQPYSWFGNVHPDRYAYGLNLEGAYPAIR